MPIETSDHEILTTAHGSLALLPEERGGEMTPSWPEQSLATFVRIVLPAYNEADALPHVLRAIRTALDRAAIQYRVFIVDDGSSDGTADAVRKAADGMPISLIQHASNRGLGGALATGIGAALAHSRPGDCVVTMDADNTHPPELIVSMLKHIDAGYDVVVASMFQAESRIIGVPKYRQALSQLARWTFQALFPIPGIRCYTSCYRAIRAEVLQNAMEYYQGQLVTERGFTSTADLLLKLRRFPLRAIEVPLVLRYDRKPGRSKMSVLRNIWETLALITRRRLYR